MVTAAERRQNMFRKAALEKLASPERLDTLMQVTSPAGWLALLAMAVVLILVVLWGFFGSMAIKVEGTGILLRGSSVLAVTSSTSGRVTEILVRPGEQVKAGQEVARVGQEDLLLRIQNQRALLADLERQQMALSTEGLEKALLEKIASQTSLVERGLLTRSALMATQEQLSGLRRAEASRQNQISELQRTIEELENRLRDSSRVVTPYSGRVIELTADSGQLIAPGERLFTLEESTEPLQAMVYVPAAEGKKVREGMVVRVSPSTVKREEYGFMLAKVSDVSEFPVTPEGLRRVLRNQSLVEQLSGSGAPIEVQVELIKSPDTPSGFEWSSSEGPPVEIFSGTLVSASIVVEEKRPVSYVLPIFRSAMGM